MRGATLGKKGFVRGKKLCEQSMMWLSRKIVSIIKSMGFTVSCPGLSECLRTITAD